MAHANCFRKDNGNLFGSDYISRKKAKAIFKGAVDVAANAKNGVVTKKNGAKYRGEVYVSNKGNCSAPKLKGASSYDQLRNVTFGKYFADPITFDINDPDNLWTGNLYIETLSGVTLDASFGGLSNTFIYPPDVNASQTYPVPGSNVEAGGLYVDPSYQIFYNSANNDDIRGTCYIKQERAYLNNVRFITSASIENGTQLFIDLASNYVNNSNNLVGKIVYPSSNLTLACQELWKNDLFTNLDVV
jgi:hypothetical protein